MNKEIEKAIEILQDFENSVMSKDKLEWNVGRGGYKLGEIYKLATLNPAIETVLNYIKDLEKENKKYKKLANKNLENEIIFREKHLPDEIYQLQVKIEKLENKLADSTPNSVIREKKKDLEKKYKEALEENSTKAFILKCQLEILEEILKEGEKKNDITSK